jgi:hypothetical protein
MTETGKTNTTIYFEPWGLGDVLIAAAILREKPADSALACKSRWHPLLRAILPSGVDLMTVELPYTTNSRRNAFDLGAIGPLVTNPCDVLNIRGDLRDRHAARRLFPAATIRFSGWREFLPHYSRAFDVPYAAGWLTVRNHYRAWAELAGVPFLAVEQAYQQRQSAAPRTGRIVVHLGSSRRSRQYPYLPQLAQLLKGRGFETDLTAGPNDPLPDGLREDQIHRLADQAVVDRLRNAEHVITNDSAAMHLAAMLGCRTLVIARVTNIHEWLPPATRFVASPQMPHGYKPDPRYNSDEVLEDWPAPEEVVGKLLAAANE